MTGPIANKIGGEPAQQHLLNQVSVFRGAFNAEAAAALVPEQSISDPDLEDLERRSLVQRLPKRDKGKLSVFRLQPRIREFVQRRTPDLTTAHERAIAYFWSQCQSEFAPGDTQDAASPYEDTFYHQCQLGHYADAAAIVFACTEFLLRRGYSQTLVDLYRPLHTNWHPTPDQRQNYAIIVCNNLGNAYHSLGQSQQAIDFSQQSLAITREIGDRFGEATSLNNLGNVYYSIGQFQQAIDYHQQTLAITREIGNCIGEANSLGNLGNACRSLRQYQRAIDFSQQSLAIQREIGDRISEALSLWNLGHCYPQQGKIRKGRECRIAALRIWQSLNLPIDVVPVSETSKRMFRTFAEGDNWAELTIQSCEQLGWFMDITDGIAFLISLPVRLVQRFKTSFVFWLLVGIAIVLLIWWLGR